MTRCPSPSECCRGFVKESDAPVLIDQGFGPRLLFDLRRKWLEIRGKDLAAYGAAVDLAQNLAAALCMNKQIGVRDEHLTSSTCSALQLLFRNFDTTLGLVHQCYIPKTQYPIDMAAVENSSSGFNIHACLEMKWKLDDREFPESQGAYYGKLCDDSSRPNNKDWMPIFVLSQNHFRFGISYGSAFKRWAYSEIHSVDDLMSFKDDGGFLHLLQFCEFFALCARTHRDRVRADREFLRFVDSSGTELPLRGPLNQIGHRVFHGVRSDGSDCTILKFYPSQTSADDAVRRGKEISKVFGYPELKAEVHCGFPTDTGLEATCHGVVILPRYAAALSFSINHIKDLVRQIQLLQSKFIVHGDARPDNILPLGDASVRLIDNDWSGITDQSDTTPGAAPGVNLPLPRFPQNVNVEAFGPRAQKHVSPGQVIGLDFDCFCLADILDSVGCNDAANAAVTGDFGAFTTSLASVETSLASDSSGFKVLTRNQYDYHTINLCCFGGRLGEFYNNIVGLPAAVLALGSSAGSSGQQSIGSPPLPAKRGRSEEKH